MSASSNTPVDGGTGLRLLSAASERGNGLGTGDPAEHECSVPEGVYPAQ